MSDPTIDEMRDHLAKTVLDYSSEREMEFDREAAIYWFASDYHGGQSSNLYSALCASQYHPGALENACPDYAQDLYDELVEAFA